MRIGEFIEFVRVERGYTRIDLADICDPKTLYRTEKGITNPSTLLLNKLSDKLNTNFSEYNLKLLNENRGLDARIKDKLLDLNSKSLYKDIVCLIEETQRNYKNLSITDRQFLAYYHAKSTFNHSGDYENALKIIERSLELGFKGQPTEDFIQHLLSDYELKTLLLKSHILFTNGDFEGVCEMLELIKIPDYNCSTNSLEYLRDTLKINYNKYYAMFKVGKTDSLGKSLLEAIDTCKKYSQLVELGRMYWLSASYFNLVNDKDKCHYYCYLYLCICEVQETRDLKTKHLHKFTNEFGYNHEVYFRNLEQM